MKYLLNMLATLVLALALTGSASAAAGAGAANAGDTATGIGFQVEAGSFQTSGNKTLGFDTQEYGSVVGDVESEAASIAARAAFRLNNGVELGIGARSGNTDYVAALGATANADRNTEQAEVDRINGDIAALDQTALSYVDDLAALQAEQAPHTARIQNIHDQHRTSTDQIGASVTAMKYTMTRYGGEVGFGGEAFIGNDGVIPAAKIAYRSPVTVGSANFGVNAVIGDGWAGANLTADF